MKKFKYILPILMLLTLAVSLKAQTHYSLTGSMSGNAMMNSGSLYHDDLTPERGLSSGMDTELNPSYMIRILDHDVSLGPLPIGERVSHLPMAGGTGNKIEFLMEGSIKDNYDITSQMMVTVDSPRGDVKVTRWTWEVMHGDTGGDYIVACRDKELDVKGMRLFKSDPMSRNAIAKLRVTIDEVKTSDDLEPGEVTFAVNVKFNVGW